MNDKLKEALKMSMSLLAVLLIALFIVTFVGQRTVVDGESMEDTLFNNENLIVEKISYRFNEPERFDIIVFPYKTKKRTYLIKRIIGLPGETIYINEDGQIFINEELLEENYGTEVILSAGRASKPITLGEDEYFVMGDNRNESSDSRFDAVGNVKRKDIIGKAWLRVFPFNKIGFVDKIK